MARGFIYKPSFFYNSILFYDKTLIKNLLSNKQAHYYSLSIPKKGGLRQLNCLKPGELKDIQSNLKKNFLDFVPVPNYVYGFVEGGSYRAFLEPHEEKEWYLRVDIKNFFDSIRLDDLKESLEYYLKVPDTDKSGLLNDVINIITLNDGVPQGAVTSPSISNIVFRELDIRLFQYCRKHKVTYTRYADDMMFSSNYEYVTKSYFIKMVARILSSKGFKINSSKLRKSSGYISVNGFVVGKGIKLSRKKKKDINKVIYMFNSMTKPIDKAKFLAMLNREDFFYRSKKEGLFFPNVSSLIHYLAGYRSFLISWLTDEAEYNQNNLKVIHKIEEMIDQLA